VSGKAPEIAAEGLFIDRYGFANDRWRQTACTHEARHSSDGSRVAIAVASRRISVRRSCNAWPVFYRDRNLAQMVVATRAP
jgi:hypothetical protein